MKQFAIIVFILLTILNLSACEQNIFEQDEDEFYVTLENGVKIKKWDFDKLDDIAMYLCRSETYSSVEIVEKEYIEEENKYKVKCKTKEDLYMIITIDLDKLYNEGILNVDTQELD